MRNLIDRAKTKGAEKVARTVDLIQGDVQQRGGRRRKKKSINSGELVGRTIPRSVIIQKTKRKRQDALGLF